MSNLALTAGNVLQGLAAGREVEIALPNGGIVRAIPSPAFDMHGNPVVGNDGYQAVQLDISSRAAGGEVEAQLRMSQTTYKYYIEKARNMMPRLALAQERLMLRSGK